MVGILMVMNLRSEKSRDEGGGRELYQMSAKVAGNGGDTSLSQFCCLSIFSSFRNVRIMHV